MAQHSESITPLTVTDNRVTLSGPADLADALPYLLGYHPDDSIVLLGLHGPQGRLGGRIRTGIPESEANWPEAARQLAACLVDSSSSRGRRPDAAVLYLCQDPPGGGEPREAAERLRPLAQLVRTACGELDVPVYEALYVSRERFLSYSAPEGRIEGEEMSVLPRVGSSPMAAAATYAGLRVRGSLKDMRQRLIPLDGEVAVHQERGLDEAVAGLAPRMVGPRLEQDRVRDEMVHLIDRLLDRFRRVPAPRDPEPSAADARDDALLTSAEAARVVVGLQDRMTRDIAAGWMEGPDAQIALRLWRALARRCVGTFEAHAAAPLTLAGWVCWSTGDDVGARVALARALDLDPEYVFARLLYQACNDEIDPEPLRASLRRQWAAHRAR
ncbi:DUF4192 domain-containing protein [Streptomyces triticirhizae]|uniref:DUF4192 domain-containing protein n=1 Tax=Streptomyces triticirhizae TaxID=2483353 RepID=A0A3M2LR27_9ACTN|nr:DUF4192 domain-containing protein [Streptomyces triticirhizae]RMI37318.1 DUF4192 domain-containing protein [Streptomyces triticirhizae]